MRVKGKQSSWSLYGDQRWFLPQVQAEIMVSRHLPLPLPVFPAHFPPRVQQSTALSTPYLRDIPTSFTPVAMETATDMPRRCKHPKLGVCFSGQELCLSLLLLHPPTLPQPWHGGGGGRCWNPKYQIRDRNIASWAVLNLFVDAIPPRYGQEDVYCDYICKWDCLLTKVSKLIKLFQHY